MELFFNNHTNSVPPCRLSIFCCGWSIRCLHQWGLVKMFWFWGEGCWIFNSVSLHGICWVESVRVLRARLKGSLQQAWVSRLVAAVFPFLWVVEIMSGLMFLFLLADWLWYHEHIWDFHILWYENSFSVACTMFIFGVYLEWMVVSSMSSATLVSWNFSWWELMNKGH